MKKPVDKASHRPILTTLVFAASVLVVVRMVAVAAWVIMGDNSLGDNLLVEIGLGLLSGLVIAAIVGLTVLFYGGRIKSDLTYESIASAVTIYAVSTLALLLFAGIVPSDIVNGDPTNLFSVVTSHIIAVGVYTISIALAGFLTALLLVRRHEQTRTYLLIQAFVLLGIWVFSVLDSVSGVFTVIAILLAVFGGIITLMNIRRLSWLSTIGLDKKIRLLWLTACGAFASITLAILLATIDDSYVTESTVAFVRSGAVLPAAINLFGFLFFLRLFFATVASLPNSGIVDRRSSEVDALSTLTRLVAESVSVDQLLTSVTEHALRVCSGHGVWTELYEGDELRVVGAQLVNEEYIRSLHSHRELHRLFTAIDHPVLVESIFEVIDDPYATSALRSVIVVPIVNNGQRTGTLVAFSTMEYGFEQDDVKLLTAFGDTVGVGIDQARLLEAEIEKERMQKEFDVARNIQASLLPRKPIVSATCDIDAVMIPAAMVGGDYYDYIRFGNGNLGVIIADVSGKGIPAALYMATLKGVVLAEMRLATGPADLLTRVNEVLFGSMERRTYISMMAVEFSEEESWLKIARAGHTPALLRLQGEIQVVTPKGVAIGIVPPNSFRDLIDEERFHVRAGDLCLLTTDGVNERRNDKFVEMSLEPLTTMMESTNIMDGKELVRQTLSVLNVHGNGTDQHDDITIVGLSVLTGVETEMAEDRTHATAGENQ